MEYKPLGPRHSRPMEVKKLYGLSFMNPWLISMMVALSIAMEWVCHSSGGPQSTTGDTSKNQSPPSTWSWNAQIVK